MNNKINYFLFLRLYERRCSLLALALCLALFSGPAQAQMLLGPDQNLDRTIGQFLDQKPDSDQEPPLFTPGQTVPDLDLPPALGRMAVKARRLSEIPARMVILNLSSYFCPPCHHEAANLKALAELIQRRKLTAEVALVTVSVGDGEEATARFMAEHQAEWTFYPDPDFAAHALLGGGPVPAFLILRQGAAPVVLDSFIGELTETPEAFLKRVLDLASGR